MARASECLNRALLYVDRTADPPTLRYLEPNDDYRIIGWKKLSDPDRPYRYRILWTIELKDGRTIVLDDDELRHLDVLLRIKHELASDSLSRFFRQ